MSLNIIEGLIPILTDNIIKIIAIIICLTIGYFGFRYKILDKSGVISGMIVGLGILVLVEDVEWFIVFIALFFVGGLTAKYKYEEKEARGVPEAKEGRSVKNIFANCGAAFICVLLYAMFDNNPIFLFGYLGAIVTAASDSAAAEIGQLSKSQPILITTLKPVKTGTDGAISLLGEGVALIVAMFISAIPYAFGIENGINYFIIGTIAGFIGCQIDTVIGAVLELRGIVDNHGTNFIATAGGAILAMGLGFFYIH